MPKNATAKAPPRNYIDESSNQEILGSRRLLESTKCKENKGKSMKIEARINDMLRSEAQLGGLVASHDETAPSKVFIFH